MNKPYPWQIKQWQRILTRWHDKTMPHALLLTGPKGLGKLHFAHSIAARLLCRKTDSDQQEHACDCASCQLILAGNHPDLLIIQPEQAGKMIKIEQIRDLLESLQQTTQQSTHQIVILEPAENMNKASANALLKTLEEPYGSVLFLLVSHQSSSVPATIRSRCQKIDFPVPPIAVSLLWLKEHTAHEDPELLLGLSDNIPLRAAAFAQASQLATHQLLVEQFIAVSQKKLMPLEMATACADLPHDTVFELLWLILCDLARLKQSPNIPIAHNQQMEALISIARHIPPTKLFSFIDKLLQTKHFLDAKINLNIALAWEALFIEWAL